LGTDVLISSSPGASASSVGAGRSHSAAQLPYYGECRRRQNGHD
jgi:hypothetical protein